MKDDGKRCCICGKAYEGYGHNPWPVKESGRCCRECNYTVGGAAGKVEKTLCKQIDGKR